MKTDLIKISPLHNKCEICGRQASLAIDERNNKGILRYTCQDHYGQLYERLENDNSKE